MLPGPVYLTLATLECDIPVPNVLAARGTYGDQFETLLRDALSKTQIPNLPSRLSMNFVQYDTVKGNLPTEEDLKAIDGFIITGSGRYYSFMIKYFEGCY